MYVWVGPSCDKFTLHGASPLIKRPGSSHTAHQKMLWSVTSAALDVGVRLHGDGAPSGDGPSSAAHRLVQAGHPAGAVLLRVEDCRVGVAAVDTLADAVAYDGELVGARDPKHVQALAHEVVLAPHLPSQAAQALGELVKERQHGLLRVHLRRPEHHGRHAGLVAVDNVGAQARVLLQDRAHTGGEHHCIRIHLDGPVGVLVLAMLPDLVPDAQEELRVPGRVIHGRAHVDRL
mmetsp:Transcript_113570/g.157043  ORF Transcript_113570/g.157043 Transcript_113570/m.157043 type:complete len:233 (-) Transcript_113570:15-713(-)